MAVLRAGCWHLSISDLASFVVRLALSSLEKKDYAFNKVRLLYWFEALSNKLLVGETPLA